MEPSPNQPPSAASAWRWALASVAPSFVAIAATLLYVNFTIGYMKALRPLPTGNTLLLAALFSAPLLLPSRRWRPALAAGLLFAVLFVAFGDLTYFRFCRDLLTPRAIFSIHQLGETLASPLDLVRPRDALAPGLCLLALAATWWVARRAPADPPPRARLAAVLATALFAPALVLAAIAAKRGGQLDLVWRHDDRVSLAYLVGMPTAHLCELAQIVAERFDTPPSALEVAEIRRWLAAKNPPRDGLPGYGLARGKNLIVLQLESFQSFPIGKTVGGVPVTPNLDALARKARFYPRMYTQAMGGGTSDAEFIMATSLYALHSGAATVRLSGNRFPTALPNMLGALGYRPTVYEGYHNPHYWNRAYAYPALGFNDRVMADQFGPGEILGPGLSDEVVLARTLPMLARREEPFYAMVLTMSSHHPLKYFDKRGPREFAAIGDLGVERYLKAVHYVDEHVGRFLRELERTGLWDRSIVVIYGDHPGLFKGSPGLTRLIGEIDNPCEQQELETTPFYLHVPGDPVVGRQDVAIGQLDMMPTVAHFLGLPTPAAFGTSVHPPRPGFVVFRDGGFVADRTFHHRLTASDWTLDGCRPAPPPPAAAHDLARRHLEVCDTVLYGDLLPQLAGDRRP